MLSLNRPLSQLSSAVPLYIQIADGLLEQIENGQLEPGSRIPSERELSTQLGVNRMTLRQALHMLESRGLLVRRQGDGTYVAEPKIEQPMGQWLPMLKDEGSGGMRLGAQVIDVSRHAAETSVARELQIPVSSQVYTIVRLRTMNQEPVVLEKLTVPVQPFPDLERFDLSARLVYDLMALEYDTQISRVRQSLEPVSASRFEAELLHIKPGASLLLERRLAFDQNGRPVEYGKDLYRGDRFRFVTETLPRKN